MLFGLPYSEPAECVVTQQDGCCRRRLNIIFMSIDLVLVIGGFGTRGRESAKCAATLLQLRFTRKLKLSRARSFDLIANGMEYDSSLMGV